MPEQTDHTASALAALQQAQNAAGIAHTQILLAEAQVHATLALAAEQRLAAQATYLASLMTAINRGAELNDPRALEQLSEEVFRGLVPVATTASSE